MKNLEIKYFNIDDLIPYANNPRNNDEAVEYVKNSIEQFGWKVPVVIDADRNVVAGHTRLKAAKELGIEEIPCIVADDLNEQQIKAFRLADNKVGEMAEWNFDMLSEELDGICDLNMEEFGFLDNAEVDWDSVDDLSEENYDSPEKDMLKCPNCGHIDSKTHFMKVNGDE